MEPFYLDNTNFSAFNQEHYYWFAYGIISTIFWIIIGLSATNPEMQRRVALWMGSLGVLFWAWSVVVMIAVHQVKTQSVLPFHLCYFLNLLLPWLFWNRRFELLDWIYPIVIAGCLQALFTPDLNQAFPHYYNVRYWFVHIALVQHVIFAIVVYRFRPSALGILKCFVAMNLYALCLVSINWVFDTNFLYLRSPAAGSIMEMLGPWPQYLYVLEVLMLVTFSIVYLPFGFLEWRSKKKRSAPK